MFAHTQSALVTSCLVLILTSNLSAAPNVDAKKILADTGVEGGLVVHLGCGDGKLTAALQASDAFLVQGLDRDAANVATARAHIQALGTYGPVTAELLEGKSLPYGDNLVNLLIAEDLGETPLSEVTRVLVPGGVSYLKEDGKWTKTVKSRSTRLDEWTHYLHSPSNNAVAQDDEVGPPRHLQWAGSPRWSRHHDHMASMSALVSTGGRMFYIFDEGSRVSILLPSKWKLIARDAFNGTILWKRDIPEWYTHLHRLKSGPAQLPRRLVAVGDRVYVTLGIGAPLVEIDASTGKTLRTYEPNRSTREVIVRDGIVFLLTQPKRDNAGAVTPEQAKRRGQQPSSDNMQVCAIRATDGEVLWRHDSSVVQLTLAASEHGVFFHDSESIVCLDARTGKQRWSSSPIAYGSAVGVAPTLVLHKDVVLFAGYEKKGNDSMVSLDAATGKTLWTAAHPPSGYRSPEDLLVSNGLVWTTSTTSGNLSGVFTGRDPRTGEVKKEFPPDVNTYWFHHRCHRGRATEKYLMTSRTGIEFIDPEKESWETHHWTRGGCLYGIMPANGMVYTPPHNCACYPEAKQYGFNALAASTPTRQIPQVEPTDKRLQRGPAYDAINTTSKIAADQWPTYRHDAGRSGATPAKLSPELAPAWDTDLGGRLSSVVVAGGHLYVASIDTHTVHALDANSGKKVWQFTTGARVDSPPTVLGDRVLFGSSDGWVYCVRATDGQLAWRFRAAPTERRLTAYEQLESVWPVPGNVLVQDGKVYCVAGRSMFLDGGLRLCCLDAQSGKLLQETVLNDKDPENKKNLQHTVQVLDMTVALPDILSSDGINVFMRSLPFDLNGKRRHTAHVPVTQQKGNDAHLFAPFGFTDGSWFHRSYWVYGRSYAGGHSGYHQAGRQAPSGRILSVDDKQVYGFGRLPKYLRWTTTLEYQLFAATKQPKGPAVPLQKSKPTKKPGLASGGNTHVAFALSNKIDPTGKPLVVSAWVKTSDVGGIVLAHGGPVNGYAIIIRDGKPRFLVRSDSNLTVATAKKPLSKEWVNLTGVLTSDKNVKLYVDGKLVATTNGTGLVATTPVQSLEIGTDLRSSVGDYPSDWGFNGAIDEVQIFHGTLTDDEIESLAAGKLASTPKTAKLAASASFGKSDTASAGVASGGKLTEGKVGDALAFVRRTKKGGRAPKKAATSRVDYQWTTSVPMLVRAMVLADKKLFIAGPADLVDEEEARGRLSEEATQKRFAEQIAALAGEKGALLWSVSAEDGETLARHRLPSTPVWDGMAITGGKLYVALENGHVVCLSGK